jgi:excisionase family DNA binding protein
MDEAIRQKKQEKTGSMKRRLMSVEETAEYLGISPRTIYNRISRGSKAPFPIRVRKIGKLIKFDVKDIEAYVDSL